MENRRVPGPGPEASMPWRRNESPSRMLVIRLHAVGDVSIAMAAAAGMIRQLPNTSVDFLTGPESADIVRASGLFARGWVVSGGAKRSFQFARLATLLPRLAGRRYEAVVDLQNNELSRAARRVLAPGAWVSFDRYSWFHAFDRSAATIDGLALPIDGVRFSPVRISPLERADLHRLGLQEDWPMVLINPAGIWPTRSWPMDHYADFCRRYRERNKATRFLVMGLADLREKVEVLWRALGDSVVDLTGKTKLIEAFRLLQRCELVVSEDSGLMHMAWVSGLRTIGLMGSTPWERGGPYGGDAVMFDSSDLPCGGCMASRCALGDVPCLTRVTPEQVLGVCDSKFRLFDGQRGRIRHQ